MSYRASVSQRAGEFAKRDSLWHITSPGVANTGSGCIYVTGISRDMKDWSEREDSNLRPPAPEAGALPGCATLRHAKRYRRVDAPSQTDSVGVSLMHFLVGNTSEESQLSMDFRSFSSAPRAAFNSSSASVRPLVAGVTGFKPRPPACRLPRCFCAPLMVKPSL